MCGRFTLNADKQALTQQFGLDFGEVLPRYNLAPTERIHFVFSNASEARQAGFARWGLVPHWSKMGKADKPLFNARSETVLEKPTFKSAFVRAAA